MSKGVKLQVETQKEGILVTLDDPRWSIEATKGGILIKPKPSPSAVASRDLSPALQASLDALDPKKIAAKLAAELMAETTAELRRRVRRLHLPVSGNKRALVERLVIYASQHGKGPS